MNFKVISPLTEERIEKLGEYFTYHNILDRTGISFERFVQLNVECRWNAKEYLA